MTQWNTETAEWYAEKYGEYATNRLGVDVLKLGSDIAVVDIGCGTGCALRHAAEKITSGALIGIDPVPRMIEIAREKTAKHSAANRIIYFEASAENLPLENASADVAFAFDSYDHWQDQAKGLREVRRVLKPNGRLIVVKDGGLPNGADAKKEFLIDLINEGFHVVKETGIQQDGVTFTQWVCAVASV